MRRRRVDDDAARRSAFIERCEQRIVAASRRALRKSRGRDVAAKPRCVDELPRRVCNADEPHIGARRRREQSEQRATDDARAKQHGRDFFPARRIEAMHSCAHPFRGSRRQRARERRIEIGAEIRASSMPTESRNSESAMPALRRASGAIDACVIVAGCATRLSTPPSDSASEKHSSPSRNASIARSPPSSSKLSIAPNPRCCRAASAWPACVRSPGQ